MAFLRLSRTRVAAFKGNKRKRDLQSEADAWVTQRQAEMRSRSCQLLGKTFATKRKAAAYAKRLVDGDWQGHGMAGKATEMRSFKARGKASMAVKPKPKPAGEAYRVRKVHGVWRRYVQAADAGWRWVSDHADMEAALAGRNPLNVPE